MGLAQPLMISIIAKSAGRDQGMAVGVRTTANRLVSFSVPVIMGGVVELVGLEASFLVIGGALMAFALAIAVHIRYGPNSEPSRAG
jgi:predicted MFS family arabinose efflux permease